MEIRLIEFSVGIFLLLCGIVCIALGITAASFKEKKRRKNAGEK